MSQLLDNHSIVDIDYFSGWKNKLIRWYFYVNRGLQAFNEFRYLIMTIFGAYYLMKLNNYFILALMFAISVVVLGVIGWIFVIKVNRITDYLSVHFSTVWSKHQIALAEDTVKILKSIDDKITR